MQERSKEQWRHGQGALAGLIDHRKKTLSTVFLFSVESESFFMAYRILHFGSN